MSRERWNVPGLSPFVTERAQSRAPQILSYAAAGGAALLVAPSGEVVMTSGSIDGLPLQSVCRFANTASSRSFTVGNACVHVTPIVAGWKLCAVSQGIEPRVIIERLRRASAVMAYALVDAGSRDPQGSPGGGAAPSGSLAEVALPIGGPRSESKKII